MEEKISYARFYVSLNKLPLQGGSRDEMKRDIVRQYTGGRTESVREMTSVEYAACCEALELLSGERELKRKRRSLCLKLMQELGIDTSDWQRINDFCRHPRIAGKPFGQIGVDELERLSVKLRAIKSHGQSTTGGKMPSPASQRQAKGWRKDAKSGQIQLYAVVRTDGEASQRLEERSQVRGN